ncbi:MAG: DUF1902 domain-containing protein [Oscillospiraceae bacterium]|nr:DUF1902 domain-containing protein [Oscillospiraceae bacterium]
MSEYLVKIQWDPEAYVWVATSGDIPGLATEAGSYDALIERVLNIIPELFEIKGIERKDIPVRFVSQRTERVYA